MHPYNMANFGLLTAEIGTGVWGTPANFNEFRVLASLLQRCRSSEANQTLHDVWPSPGLVHYIYFFRGSCPLTEFCQVQNSLCVQVFPSSILAALLHGTPAAGVSQTLRRGTKNGITELSQRAPPAQLDGRFQFLLWHCGITCTLYVISLRALAFISSSLDKTTSGFVAVILDFTNYMAVS